MPKSCHDMADPAAMSCMVKVLERYTGTPAFNAISTLSDRGSQILAVTASADTHPNANDLSCHLSPGDPL